MTDPKMLNKAVRLAKTAHKGQVDKGWLPYYKHLEFVANHVVTIDEKTVAWLHDIVEDTDTSLDDLRAEGFDEIVVAAVDAMTKREAAGESYEDYIERVKADPIARKVKTADLRHNMNTKRIGKITPEVEEKQKKYRFALKELQGK